MPHAPDLTGVALDGRYELHALIGEGTFGRVYRGQDRRLARRVAVKVIKPWWAEDPEWVRGFEREAQLLASVSDPGIVQIFDVGSAPEGLYYVAEMVVGQSLVGRLRHGPVGPDEACDIAEQLARALAGAHARRVVHRDVKPANVLISSDGRVKVTDFGVARLAEGTTDGVGATIVGTPRYMAPEQARGGHITPATDVYGVGVVLYEMLAGHPPFKGSSAVELALAHVNDRPPPLPAHTPMALVEVVECALAKEPAGRYRDGARDGGRARRRAWPVGGRVRLSHTGADIRGRGGAPGAARDHELDAGAAAGGGQDSGAPPGATPSSPGSNRSGRVSSPRLCARCRRRRRSGPIRPGSPRHWRRDADSTRPSAAGESRCSPACCCWRRAWWPGRACSHPEYVRVPKLLGLSRGRASAAVRRAGLHVSFRRHFSQAPKGIVIDQSPRRGVRVADGDMIDATLSAGPPPVTVPNVAGRPASDAEADLARSNLRFAVRQVPAPGAVAGAVTRESPAGGAKLAPRSIVALTVAEPPRLRPLTSFAGASSGRSVPFRIRGSRWQLISDLSYQGTCAFIFVCSGPTATVVNLTTGATVDQFSLAEGGDKVRSLSSGPGVYQISVSPGSDAARWAIKVDDYY